MVGREQASACSVIHTRVRKIIILSTPKIETMNPFFLLKIPILFGLIALKSLLFGIDFSFRQAHQLQAHLRKNLSLNTTSTHFVALPLINTTSFNSSNIALSVTSGKEETNTLTYCRGLFIIIITMFNSILTGLYVAPVPVLEMLEYDDSSPSSKETNFKPVQDIIEHDYSDDHFFRTGWSSWPEEKVPAPPQTTTFDSYISHCPDKDAKIE